MSGTCIQTSPRRCSSRNSQQLGQFSRSASAVMSSLAAHWVTPTSTSNNLPMVSLISSFSFASIGCKTEFRPCARFRPVHHICFASRRLVDVLRIRACRDKSQSKGNFVARRECDGTFQIWLKASFVEWNFIIFSLLHSCTNTCTFRRSSKVASWLACSFFGVCALLRGVSCHFFLHRSLMEVKVFSITQHAH
jgi:hypothetical protein